ncbi:MAG TPA: hypothetical protein VL980_00245 [Gemmatimonadaceae bacterium]|nr:hypothetical protein [Gemmatimonadaceae bacterium]
MRSMDDQTFHLMPFEHRGEAAAFVTAFSRFLDSPRGAGYLEPPGAVQIWSHAGASHGAIDVYLTADALAAATAAFAPVIGVATNPNVPLPEGSTLLIGAERAPSWGLEEAERVLGAS